MVASFFARCRCWQAQDRRYQKCCTCRGTLRRYPPIFPDADAIYATLAEEFVL